MAKFTLGGSWLGGFFGNLASGTYSRASRDERRLETAESKLRRQQTAHRARIYLLDKEIAECETAKCEGARTRNRELVLASIAQRRRTITKRRKYQQLHDFCENMLESIQDAATISQTMNTIRDVRVENRAVDMSKIYDKLGTNVSDFDSFRNETRLAQSLFEDSNAASATPDGNSGEPMHDADTLAELEEVMAAWEGSAAAAVPEGQASGEFGPADDSVTTQSQTEAAQAALVGLFSTDEYEPKPVLEAAE